MLLAIDIGNTQTTFGVYEQDDSAQLVHMWRIATNREDTTDDVCTRLWPLFHAVSFDPKQIDACTLASVVPTLTTSWVCAVKTLAGIDVLVCSAQVAADRGLFETSYPNPSEIGADRVADAVAIRELFGAPAVVVDFGTATNIEVIDSRGSFVGGIIAPGVQTGAEALFSHATRLAAVDLIAPATVIGTSSEQAMRSGIVYGEADRVDGLIRRVFEQIGCTCPVIATGGFAELVAQHSAEITDVVPELTLEGLRIITQATS